MLAPKVVHYFRLWQVPLVKGELGLEKRRLAYLESARAVYHEGYQKVRMCALRSRPPSSRFISSRKAFLESPHHEVCVSGRCKI
jgi:hypothetical protein